MRIGYTSRVIVRGEEAYLDLDFNIIPEYFRELVETLQIKHPKNFSLARAGNVNDGGYILINNLSNRNGIAYSFGINDDVSFDNAIANCGYDVFMYDMTIDDLPYHRPEFHFFKEGIGGKFDSVQKLDTLDHFIQRNGHQNQRNMILKMDVEGAEYDFIEQTDLKTLEQFDQMTFEFHDVIMGINLERANRIISCFKKLNQTHQVIHLHANNNGQVITYEGGKYPELLEVTYANRANYEFIDNEEIILPLPNLDSPNLPQYPEITLGNWNKRWK